LSGIGSGSANETQTLSVTAISSNPGLIPIPTVNYTSPNTTGKLTFKPVLYNYGTATISVTVNDAQSQNNTVTRSFTVTVNSGANQPPTLDSLSDVTIVKNAGLQTVNLTGISSGAANETQTLTVTARTSGEFFIPNLAVNYTSPNATGTLTFTTASNVLGQAAITVTVNDGQSTVSRTFLVTTVDAVNQPATLSALSNLASSDAASSFSAPVNSAITPSLPAGGTYNGLFLEDAGARLSRAGSFTITVTARGTYSGRLQLGDNRYSFTGRFDSQGRAISSVARENDLPLTLELQMGSGDQADQIFGRVTDGVWVAAVSGDRAAFNATTNPSPYAGSYTVLIPGSDEGSAPMGTGFARIIVDANGLAQFAGKLVDGTKISYSAPVSKDGFLPLYIPLYSGKGAIMGWLSMGNGASDGVNGTLVWMKSPDASAAYFSNGFNIESAVTGSVLQTSVE
jgi:hypothetical protein